MLSTAKNQTLVDSYVLDQLVAPFPDDCQSWTWDSSIVESNLLIFEAGRLLDTGDEQDRRIVDDRSLLVPACRVIVAWGDTIEPSFHGPNGPRSAVRFFGTPTPFAAAMDSAEGSFTLKATDYLIRSDRDTT